MGSVGSSPHPARCDPRAGGPSATLADVDVRSELDTRPRRAPDYEREHGALAVLAREMADNPRNMLQKLAEIAVDLCECHTAGISLLDGDVFRWEAVAGVFAAARGGTMPRAESPCGVCIDRDATQLMHLADRCFPALFAEPRFVEALLIPFHDHGAPIGTVWVVSHDDERKFDAEDERIVSVLAQFASAGWQLWRSYEAAAEAGRRKDDFLAELGHELRNPLAAIMTAASMLRRQIDNAGGATHAVDVVTRQCQHVSRLVEDLLDVARIGSGKLQLNRKVVDLRTIVAETVDAARRQIERRQHRLDIELGPDPVMVNGDPVRLAQVISNLLDNAAKYTPDGGAVSIALARSGDETAEIAIRDTGEGLPPEQLTTIFERFTQLNQASHAALGGLGLGLSLVRSLTELHGGTVRAASAGEGRGSCFTVRLPLHPAGESTEPSFERRGTTNSI
jgi:signal transduction histidine kinase